ncbi:flagellar biosynthesis protein FlhB [Chitinimonas sp. BJB300]|uniref:flagellar biosynthesis protein FlhB n=1 Tax=Chitinimonas sp. BJB300 TaxID=1559339 RepID=UPI000C0C6F37|nr:flagellar biosynthesis protein FlhB [Chitinimonas sp. BJB300]PHV11973.1 flagellar biosynthetic protein FlhB [Chitinimonas sp. BJB300]TSJ87264.1 flagellar type III secretion system protein FlhB [Chitinimonas sp. BJB300]
MAEDSDLERTEDPSPRRLEEARNNGQVARSHELVTFSVVMTGLVMLIVTGDSILATLKQITINNLTFNRAVLGDIDQLLVHFSTAAFDALRALIPVLVATAVAAIASSIVISGWLFTFDALEPKFSKLNPMTGIGRILSVRSLVEMVKAILKSGLIGGVAIATIWFEKEQIIQMIAMPPFASLAFLFDLTKTTLLMVAGSMLLIVAIDVPFQLWDYKKNLRMTKAEVKQESKESDGDPQVKAKIRQLQMQAARQRMMSEIPKADVIVTNPTHYAVALQYDEQKMKAPRVIAKGSFLLAERIIELGRDNKVPILRTPPLARALYHHAELGEDIPTPLYNAVAEVLAYIYQLNHFERYGGLAPALSKDLPVPPDLDPGGEA